MEKKYSLTLIGIALSSVLSGWTASAADLRLSINKAIQEDQEAAVLLSELIASGHLAVNPQTGAIQLKDSVLSILDKYGTINKNLAPLADASGCSGTTGDGCMSPAEK